MYFRQQGRLFLSRWLVFGACFFCYEGAFSDADTSSDPVVKQTPKTQEAPKVSKEQQATPKVAKEQQATQQTTPQAPPAGSGSAVNDLAKDLPTCAESGGCGVPTTHHFFHAEADAEVPVSKAPSNIIESQQYKLSKSIEAFILAPDGGERIKLSEETMHPLIFRELNKLSTDASKKNDLTLLSFVSDSLSDYYENTGASVFKHMKKLFLNEINTVREGAVPLASGSVIFFATMYLAYSAGAQHQDLKRVRSTDANLKELDDDQTPIFKEQVTARAYA